MLVSEVGATVIAVTRPDGSMASGPAGGGPAVREAMAYWADRLSDHGFKTVLACWFTALRSGHA